MDFTFIEDADLRAQAEEGNKAELKELNEGIDTKISDAIAGLKNKNEELLGEKKLVQEKLATFKDITDPEKALEALTFINENEEAQMIKDGRFNELMDKRTSQMKIDHDTAVTDLADKLIEMTDGKGKYKGLYQTKMLDDAMRAVAIKAGVLPGAIDDVLLRAKSVFTLGTDGTVEARTTDNKLLKNEDGNVVTPTVWVEGLKVGSQHYWPSSEGAGAVGGNITGDADTTERLATLSKAGKMAEYRVLRNKMRGIA